jgi:hypothetical protein
MSSVGIMCGNIGNPEAKPLSSLRYLYWIVIAIMAMSVSAFAKDIEVTFNASPNGAMLIVGGKAWGTTPVTLKYKPSKKEPCFSTGPMSVQWISGAVAAVENVNVCKSVGKKQVFQFMRPSGITGVAVDAQYAGQLEQIRLVQQQMHLQQIESLTQSLNQQNAQAEAANQRNFQQLQQSLLQMQNNLVQQQTQTQQQNLRCTSHFVGSFIYTTCQ